MFIKQIKYSSYSVTGILTKKIDTKSITQEEFTKKNGITDPSFYNDLKTTLMKKGSQFNKGKFLYFVILDSKQPKNPNFCSYYLATNNIGDTEVNELLRKLSIGNPHITFTDLQLLQHYGGLKYKVRQYVDLNSNFKEVAKPTVSYEQIMEKGTKLNKDSAYLIQTNVGISNLMGSHNGIITVPLSISAVGLNKEDIYEIFKKAKQKIDLKTFEIKKINNILCETEQGPFYIAHCYGKPDFAYGLDFIVEFFGSQNKFYYITNKDYFSESQLVFKYKTREEAERVLKAYKFKGTNVREKYCVCSYNQAIKLIGNIGQDIGGVKY